MHQRFLIAKECVTALWPSLAAYHKATRPFLVSSWVTNILNLLFLKCPISHINMYHHWLKIIQFLISDKMMMTMKKMTSAEAPLSTSNLATSRYPAWAAQCKAVQPSCSVRMFISDKTFPFSVQSKFRFFWGSVHCSRTLSATLRSAPWPMRTWTMS